MLPNRLIVSAYAVRNFQLWVLVRLVISAVFFFGWTDPLHHAPITLCAIAICSAMVSLVEIYRRNEFDLLGNLGIGWLAISALSLGPPLFGELLVYAIVVLVA